MTKPEPNGVDVAHLRSFLVAAASCGSLLLQSGLLVPEPRTHHYRSETLEPLQGLVRKTADRKVSGGQPAFSCFMRNTSCSEKVFGFLQLVSLKFASDTTYYRATHFVCSGKQNIR